MADLDTLVAGLDIHDTLPVSALHPAGRSAADDRLRRLVTQVLPGYASMRNDATRPDGASGLSPYLHFGVLGPREVMVAVVGAQAEANTSANLPMSFSAGGSGSTSRRVGSMRRSGTIASPAGR
ncbi:hypothetical protein AB5I41_08930 [Sphingomonas sp. MMS24-JH45]